jgi:hypothetical protein
MKEDKIVLIKVAESTREALKREGIKGETYDVIIKRLIKLTHKGKRQVAEDGRAGYV